MSSTKPSQDYLECLHQWTKREEKWAGSKSKLARLLNVSRPAIYDWLDTNTEQFIDETSKLKIFAYCETYNRQPPYCLVDTASDSELEALMEIETDLTKVARAVALGISKLGSFQPQSNSAIFVNNEHSFINTMQSQLKVLLLLEMDRQGMLGNNVAFAEYLAIPPEDFELIIGERRTPTTDELVAIASKVATPAGKYHDFDFFDNLTKMREDAPEQSRDRGQKNGKNGKKSSNGATV